MPEKNPKKKSQKNSGDLDRKNPRILLEPRPRNFGSRSSQKKKSLWIFLGGNRKVLEARLGFCGGFFDFFIIFPFFFGIPGWILGKFGEFFGLFGAGILEILWIWVGKGFWREFLELVPNFFFHLVSQILGFLSLGKKKLGIIPA